MKSKHTDIVLFFIGFILFLFTRRSEIFPTVQAAILIAPVFILRFIRTQSAQKGIWLTLLGFFLSMNSALWGLYAIHNITEMIFTVVRSSLLAILYFLPYMIDRFIYPKCTGREVLSTLIFPISTTAVFFLSSLEGPFDGVVAKDIYSCGPLILLQLNSVTGLWGFIFLFSWIASMINYFWENDFSRQKIKRPAFALLSVIILILLFGAIKLSPVLNHHPPTVRIASVILIPGKGKVTPIREVYENKLISPFDETVSQIEHLTKIASQNSAEIIAFQEYSITIEVSGEKKLRNELQRIARENNVYLSVSYAYFGDVEKGKNKSVFVDNRGTILIDYSKRYLLGIGPIGETGVFTKGAEVIQSVETPYGRIAVSICRDMNFPSYMRQAAQQDVDIMINPSYDYPKSVTPDYYERAIEFGFSTVRPTYNGISYMEDYNGTLLALMDSDETSTGILYAEVPTRGIKTIYGSTGDVLGWLCVALLLVLIVPLSRNKLLRCFEK